MGYRIKQSRISESFRCIAEKCPATCCSGWSVIWTKNEIEQLKRASGGILSERCSRAFPVVGSYTAVQMDENELCPFLCDGLCSIHQQLGEEYLSYTCREYPRITRLIGNTFIRSCKTTCYAVAERLFQDNDCMHQSISSLTGNISAVIALPEEAEMQEFLDIIERYLRNEEIDIREALIKTADLFDIERSGPTEELNNVFEKIFGWQLVIPDSEEDKAEAEGILSRYCPNAIRNIILSLFMEWRMAGISAEYTLSENYCAFLFSCAVIIQTIMGAAINTHFHEEFICTVCDIAGLLYSDKGVIERIAQYLKENKLSNIEFFTYIL